MHWKSGVLMALCLLNGPALVHAAPQVPPDLPSYMTQIDGSTDPSDIPGSAATWFFYRTLLNAEEGRPGTGAEILERVVGLDTQTAGAVLMDVQEAKVTLDARAGALRREKCSQLSNMPVNTGHVLEEIADFERSLESLQAELAQGVSLAISPGSSQQIQKFIDAHVRPGMTILTIDVQQAAEVTGTGADSLISSLCAPPILAPQPIHN